MLNNHCHGSKEIIGQCTRSITFTYIVENNTLRKCNIGKCGNWEKWRGLFFRIPISCLTSTNFLMKILIAGWINVCRSFYRVLRTYVNSKNNLTRSIRLVKETLPTVQSLQCMLDYCLMRYIVWPTSVWLILPLGLCLCLAVRPWWAAYMGSQTHRDLWESFGRSVKVIRLFSVLLKEETLKKKH